MKKFKPRRKITIKDLRPEDRPLQRLIEKGPQALSNSELLAILLWKVPKDSVLNKVNEIFKKYNLRELSQASVEELKNLIGDRVKACQLIASFELARRWAEFHEEANPLIESPEDLAKILIPQMRDLKKECFKVALLDSRNRLMKIEDISIGTLDTSVIHPREIFKPAIVGNAASIILIHNHPSGDPEPSKEDLKITKKVIEAGKFLGIKVLDHIIIGGNSCKSLKDFIY